MGFSLLNIPVATLLRDIARIDMSNQKKSAYEGVPQGGDTNFRKEWDTEEYAQKAKEREAEVKRKGRRPGSRQDC